MLLMEHSLEQLPFACQEQPPFNCSWLSPDEAALYASFHQDLTEEEIYKRLSSGERCFIGRMDHRIVHGFWVVASNARIDFLNIILPLNPGELYLYQSFTSPEIRGRGFATTTLASALEVVRSEGFRRVLCCIQSDRAMGYPPFLRTGFVPSALLSSVWLGPWRWVSQRPTDHLPFLYKRLSTRNLIEDVIDGSYGRCYPEL
jgi:GNAT superfamily N-acetyltransferase